MTMPTASIREYAFELVKASFHKLLTSSLSVIASDTALLREKNTALCACKNLIQNKHAITF